MRASEFVTEEAKASKFNGLLMKYAFNDSALVIKAFTKEGPIAFVKFVKENKELYPQNLWVNDEYRSRGIAKSMYDFLKSEGYIINRSHDQTKAGAGFWDKHRGEDQYVWEDDSQKQTTLKQLYNGHYPSRDEMFWDYVRSGEFDIPLDIQAMPKHKLSIMLLSQYRVEHLDEITDMMDEEQKEIVDKYMNDPQLSNKIIVIADDLIVDGNHRAMAAALKGVGINYVDLAELDDEEIDEEVIDEMPLPADWDPQQMRQQNTSFKSRLQYALDRAKKLGVGSSRVATIIEYEGRPTVLKIAKNQKGLAQNSVEADILSDGYASQLGILIPIIDYDEQNREPSWVHTEMATKANEKQLCHLMGCDSLSQLVRFANTIAGKYRGRTAQQYIDDLINSSKNEQDIEKMTEYANILADLANSFDVELGDFDRAANWGIYQGKPVIVDVGFNSNVLNQYYK